jgi:AhpD family alkylhydroperoxidase
MNETLRVDPYAAAPELFKLLIDFSNQMVKAAGLEPRLVELVKIRASQINGCSVCLHMHTTEARKKGETEERLYLLDAWRETPFYSERERAALGWTEALTRLSETRAPDADYEALKAHFNAEEQVKLTMLINLINDFNRLGVGFRRDASLLTKRAAA